MTWAIRKLDGYAFVPNNLATQGKQRSQVCNLSRLFELRELNQGSTVLTEQTCTPKQKPRSMRTALPRDSDRVTGRVWIQNSKEKLDSERERKTSLKEHWGEINLLKKRDNSLRELEKKYRKEK